MSQFLTSEVNCPRCAAVISVQVAESVNVSQHSHYRDEILAGRFHVAECLGCHGRFNLDRGFYYSDFGRQQFAQVFPDRDRRDWRRAETAAGRNVSDVLLNAPQFLELGPEKRVRAVFGLGALAEKLRIWDAGLDDGLIELLKLGIFTHQAARGAAPHVRIRLAAIDSGISFEFVEVPVGGFGDAITRHVLPWSGYDALLTERERMVETYPGLFYMPYVDFARLAVEGVGGGGLG